MSQVVDQMVQGSQATRPFEDDFIMVAEFSEQEGPKPLFTIPRDGGGKFDKNTFSVRVMAVDYGSVTGSFQVTEDTQVVLTEGYEPAAKVYAFVYHFTLYDIQARGYVRPFCMVYLSVDEMKIMLHFEELLQEFKKVSDFLKHGNWPIFEEDLRHRKADLEHTRDELMMGERDHEGEPSSMLGADRNLEQCCSNLEEVKDMLEVVKNYVGKYPDLDAQVCRFEELIQSQKPLHRQTSLCNLRSAEKQEENMEEEESPTSEPVQTRKRSNTSPAIATELETSPYKPNILDLARGRRFDQKLRSLVGLSGTSGKLGLSHLRRIHKHFGRDYEAVVFEGEEFQSLEPWSALLTIGRRIVLNFLHGIERCCAQCEWPPSSWRTEGFSIPNYYRCQSALTVSSWDEKSFKSCIEDLSSIEADAATPPLFPADTSAFFDPNEDSGSGGSNQLPNFLQFAEDEAMHSIPGSSNSSEPQSPKQVQQQQMSANAPPNDRLLGWLQSTKVHAARQPEAQPSTQGQSSDGSDSNSLSELRPNHQPVQPMLASSHAQDAAVGVVMTGTIANQHSPSFWYDDDETANEATLTPAASLSKAIPLSNDTLSGMASTRSPSTHSSVPEPCISDEVGEKVVRPHELHLPHRPSNHDHPEGNMAAKLLTLSSSQLPSNAHMHRGIPEILAQEKGNPLTPTMSMVYSSTKSAPLQPLLPQISSASDDLCQPLDDKPGHGLLKFRDRYVFAMHLVYALLRGRPVIVLGKSESAVRAMVQTLSVFVPGHSSQHQIVRWFTKPLNITHLARLKLVGLRRGPGNVIPRAVRPYVSILDHDTSTLTTPPYKGTFVNSIVRRQNKWKDDRSYLAHVHSVFLEMASKAYLYFHIFCLNSPTPARSDDKPMPKEKSQSRASKVGFLARIGVVDCDIFIIEYLVEVVKMQQMADYQRANDMDGEDYPPTIRLDHSRCNVYTAGSRPGRFAGLG